MKKGDLIYLKRREERSPFDSVPLKRHHVTVSSYVLLKGIVEETCGNEIKVKLVDNNGFERDNDSWIFELNEVIEKVNDSELGVWSKI